MFEALSLVIAIIVISFGLVFFGDFVADVSHAKGADIEKCKIQCHPQESEWLPQSKVCLCKGAYP
jgi:hypothetical protein